MAAMGTGEYEFLHPHNKREGRTWSTYALRLMQQRIFGNKAERYFLKYRRRSACAEER
jgi:hypothetical protein